MSRVVLLHQFYYIYIPDISFPDSFLVCGNKRRGAHVVTALSVCKIITNSSACAAEFYVNPKPRAPILSRATLCFIFAKRQLNTLINVIWFLYREQLPLTTDFSRVLPLPVSPSSPLLWLLHPTTATPFPATERPDGHLNFSRNQL